MHGKNVKAVDRLRDRCQIARGVERQLGKQRRINRQIAGRKPQRVTIGRRLRDYVHADNGGSTATVIHDDLLADGVADFLENDACYHVGAPARRPRHDQAQGPCGIPLRERYANRKLSKRRGQQALHD